MFVLLASLLAVAPAARAGVRAGIHDGGTAILDFSSDPVSMDPAIAADGYSLTILHVLFVTLLTNKPGTTTVVPWGATEMPTITNGGKRYVVHIHAGIKFSDGEPADAHAFKYSFERILIPATKSPYTGSLAGVVGASDFVAGKAKSVAGIKVLDPLTIQFDLVQPDNNFLYDITYAALSAVPQKAVEAAGAKFATHPTGDGQFILQNWTSGVGMTLVKNLHYFDAATAGHLDKLLLHTNVPTNLAVLQVEKGMADISAGDVNGGDGIPLSLFLTIKNDPRWKSYLYHSTLPETWFFVMAMRDKPLQNVKVRQAIAYAINRQKIVQILNGRGVLASQIMPPSLPGYDPSIPQQEYNPAKARKLLTEAGFPHGFQTSITMFTTPPGPQEATSIQYDLAQVGIQAVLRIVSLAQYSTLAATPGGSPTQINDWLAIEPALFMNWTYNSNEIQAGNNMAEFAVPQVDALLNKAQQLPLAQAVPLWQRAQRLAISQYGYVPLYYGVEYDFVNPRIGGFQIDPNFLYEYQQWYLK
ncbi:MAG: transporter substrate-binding protein [Chloroflexi bacterium]|nr:transporter substrate-binding protein [Chloroflexota bacterium]